MKRTLISILVLMMMNSCYLFRKEPIYAVDPELDQYYMLFLSEGMIRGQNNSHRDVSILFGDLSSYYKIYPGIQGIAFDCSWSRLEVNIVIDEKRWAKKDLISREVIMMHELGHAALGLHHSPDEDCESIMRSDLGCVIVNYKTLRTEMLNKLFGRTITIG